MDFAISTNIHDMKMIKNVFTKYKDEKFLDCFVVLELGQESFKYK